MRGNALNKFSVIYNMTSYANVVRTGNSKIKVLAVVNDNLTPTLLPIRESDWSCFKKRATSEWPF